MELNRYIITNSLLLCLTKNIYKKPVERNQVTHIVFILHVSWLLSMDHMGLLFKQKLVE